MILLKVKLKTGELSLLRCKFNHSARIHLTATLDSLMHQTMDSSNFEIICVNDCSTDNSKEVIEEYSKMMRNIILIDRSENSGGCVWRNNESFFTAGNVADNHLPTMIKLFSKLKGWAFADKGFINQKAVEQLLSKGLHLITGIRQNMKK